MEKPRNPNSTHRVGAVLAATSLALVLEGCGHGSYEVPADTPLTVLDKYDRKRFVTAEQNGGHSKYEHMHYFVVEQCEDVNPAIVEDDGCVDLSMRVSEETYDQYQVNDVIVYGSPRRAYPVEG